MHFSALVLSFVLAVLLGTMTIAAALHADELPSAGGRYLDKEGNPTYNVQADGTVDWYTFSGFRRFHAECQACHGAEGGGSTFAPALRESAKRLSYDEFKATIIQGRMRETTSGTSVMPAFGENLNVMCFIDDIWTYLKARASEAIPYGRPTRRNAKPAAAAEYENACMAMGAKSS
jgi:methanol metabolism-related c-type cytochrome